MDERRPIDATAAATMVVLCALWGTQQVTVKLAAAAMSPTLQIGLRSGVASLVVLILVLLRREGFGLRRENWGAGALAGGLFGLEFLLIGEGLRFTSASHMSIFLYTAPIFAALALHLRVPQERLVPLQWAGIGVAFAGVVLAFAGKGTQPASATMWIGDLLGIAAAATWGATTFVIRTSRLARAPAAVTLWYQLVGAFVLGVGGSAMLGLMTVTVTPQLLAILAYQSFVIAAASYLVWFTLMRVYLASRLGVLAFMTPIFGIGFGVLILDEELTVGFVLGVVLILLGILLVSGRDLLVANRRRKAERTTSPAKSSPVAL